jgi:hypothetical protein
MSTFQNSSPEPRQVFLDLLMKNADFLGQQMATRNYTGAVSQMLRIVTDIKYMASKTKINALYEKLERWVFESGNYTSRDAQEAHAELKEILQTEFFSELKIGIIPTSTLPMEKNIPSSEPMSGSSSRL